MPKLVSEIASGAQFTRSASEGSLADAQTRTFRILLNQPGEVVDIQRAVGVNIGDPHPVNRNVLCNSWDAKFEGDSRTVILATFNYQSTASSKKDEDKNNQPPDIRPANWSTSTNIIEVPVQTWREVTLDNQGAWLPVGVGVPAHNPVGDMYDGVSRYEAVVTITIEQYEPEDPTRHCLFAGSVNSKGFEFGSIACFPGSVMFRGVQAKPVVESWGGAIYRGWTATYEFAFRKNHVVGIWVNALNAAVDADIGWDIAVPQTGFNVKAFVPANANADQDQFGEPLLHKSGKIHIVNGIAMLPANIAANQKVRSMVLVHEYENGGASQLPSAQPIPLNMDGTPRKEAANPKVILRRWRTNEEIDFVRELGLRLT